MKIVAVIQARMGSSRLPGKVLLPVAGAPLLERMLERVRAARLVDEVMLATTTEPRDGLIAELGRRLGVRVYTGHPTDLLDRHVGAGRAAGADVVVKIPSDCPLIDPSIIDAVVAAFRAAPGAYDYVSNLHPATYPDGNDVEVVPLPVLELAAREAWRPHEREHTTPFIWDQPARFRLHNVAQPGERDQSMSHRFTIDYAADYEFVRAVYAALYRPGAAPFTLADILGFLAERPDVHALNQHLRGVNWYRHHLADLATVSAAETVVPADAAKEVSP